VRAALHEKHAEDFPGILGLEEVVVEVQTKDAARGGSGDAYDPEVRAFGTARFALWRRK
jgi:hypothetical protein